MKYYNYLSEALKQRDSFLKAESEIKEQIADLDAKNKAGYVAPAEYREKIKSLKSIKTSLIGESRSKIQKIQEDVAEFFRHISTPQGELLHPDIKLLNNGYKLTSKEVEQLAEKHRYNYTMLRALKDYAKENNLSAHFPPSAEERESAFNSILSIISKGMSGNEYFHACMERDNLKYTIENNSAFIDDIDNFADSATKNN